MAMILIADDSPTALAQLRQELAPLGHEIVEAVDGEDAQVRLDAKRPDLVILDIIMPKLNGFQLCRRIRANPNLEGLPIIVVTAMDRESDRYWGLKQGADDFLVKPIDGDELREKVRSYLS
ncbi:MAG: response regulator [Deltaproteobacteria bacterium]|nr:response regulator [Deltaproteobacteria bacterium]